MRKQPYTLATYNSINDKVALPTSDWSTTDYIRLVLEEDTDLGWWARRRFIRLLHQTGHVSYRPRVACRKFKRVEATYSVDYEE